MCQIIASWSWRVFSSWIACCSFAAAICTSHRGIAVTPLVFPFFNNSFADLAGLPVYVLFTHIETDVIFVYPFFFSWLSFFPIQLDFSIIDFQFNYSGARPLENRLRHYILPAFLLRNILTLFYKECLFGVPYSEDIFFMRCVCLLGFVIISSHFF